MAGHDEEHSNCRHAILAGVRLTQTEHMSSALTLRAAITRGALVSLANWQIVLIDFVVESLFKAAVAVPVVGGAFMVAVLLDVEVGSLLGDGTLAAIERMHAALGQAPMALAAFITALTLVAIGGAVLMFVAKAGTLAVLVDADLSASELQRSPLGSTGLRSARTFSLANVLDAIRHFRRRSSVLAVWLGGAYFVVWVGYLLIVGYGFQWAEATGWVQAWPLLVLVATSALFIALIAANLVFDLVRIVMINDDCGLVAAWGRVRRFLLADSRQVLSIFGAMGIVTILATLASATAAWGLALVAWVPLAGLIVLPLQAAFWIVRGLFFQFTGLTTLSAYQTQYRRFSRPLATSVEWKVKEVQQA